MSDVAALSAHGRTSEATTRPILPLSVRGLVLRHGETATIDNLDLDLGPTGCTVVLGPNGAGKSLLLRLLHGLIAPTSGQIDWADRAPAKVMHRQALVFQKPVLLRRTVAANIDFVLRARGLDRSRTVDLLDRVGLAHKARQPARLLSGGEAQRLALARALATGPEVLFLDEPTASLDPGSVLAIETIVKEALKVGVRVVFVTHDVGQARRMADDVVFLQRGRVAEHAQADIFFDSPETQAANDFLNGRITP